MIPVPHHVYIASRIHILFTIITFIYLFPIFVYEKYFSEADCTQQNVAIRGVGRVVVEGCLSKIYRYMCLYCNLQHSLLCMLFLLEQMSLHVFVHKYAARVQFCS